MRDLHAKCTEDVVQNDVWQVYVCCLLADTQECAHWRLGDRVTVSECCRKPWSSMTRSVVSWKLVPWVESNAICPANWAKPTIWTLAISTSMKSSDLSLLMLSSPWNLINRTMFWPLCCCWATHSPRNVKVTLNIMHILSRCQVKVWDIVTAAAELHVIQNIGHRHSNSHQASSGLSLSRRQPEICKFTVMSSVLCKVLDWCFPCTHQITASVTF